MARLGFDSRAVWKQNLYEPVKYFGSQGRMLSLCFTVIWESLSVFLCFTFLVKGLDSACCWRPPWALCRLENPLKFSYHGFYFPSGFFIVPDSGSVSGKVWFKGTKRIVWNMGKQDRGIFQQGRKKEQEEDVHSWWKTLYSVKSVVGGEHQWGVEPSAMLQTALRSSEMCLLSGNAKTAESRGMQWKCTN